MTSVVSADETSVVSADKTSVVSLCQQTSPKTSPRHSPHRGGRHNRCFVCRHIGFGWGAPGPKWFSAVSCNIWLRLEYRVLDSAWFFKGATLIFSAPGPDFRPGARFWPRGQARAPKLEPGPQIWKPNRALGPLGAWAQGPIWALWAPVGPKGPKGALWAQGAEGPIQLPINPPWWASMLIRRLSESSPCNHANQDEPPQLSQSAGKSRGQGSLR